MFQNNDANMEDLVDGQLHRYPNLPQVEDEDEWSYVMRRTMQEIVPGLFLGPYAAATRNSLDKMKAAGLTHVVCVRSDIEAHLIRANHMEHFQYLIVQMDDPPMESIIPKLRTVSAFIERCLKNGGKVLVHGNAGMCRSAVLVVGYIMSKYGVNFKQATKFVQSKRFCISVSEAYNNQLWEYEPIYRAMNGVVTNNAIMESEEYRAIKRSIEEMVGGDDEDDNGRAGHRPHAINGNSYARGESMDLE